MTTTASPGPSDHLLPGTPLVGRSREQDFLRSVLDHALGGNGSLVLVSGEAGIGKTSLVTWLAGEARLRSVQVLAGHCYDLSVTPPYGPWLDALSSLDSASQLPAALRLLGEDDGPGPVTSQSLLFEQVRAFLQGVTSSRPVVLVLEDLHWSDPASLELLRYLSRGITDDRLLLIVTFRDDELPHQHPLSLILPLLVREARAERIELQALTDDDVQALIRNRYPIASSDEARLIAYLQSRTEGNPFYLGEVLRTLESERLLQSTASGWLVGELDRMPVPPLVRQVIEGRLARLDLGARRLLEIASVVGHDVPFDIWQTASGEENTVIIAATQVAVDAQLMLDSPAATSVRFTHALVRETLYFGQSLADRQALHRRIAEFLVDRPAQPLNLIASHFASADDPRAIEWLMRAGERALELYAAQDAIAALARAHDLAVRFAGDLPLAAYRTRASAYAMLGEFDRARRDYELILDRGRVTGDRQAEWQALVDLGSHWSERDYERAGRYCQAALDLAREIGDQPTIAHSLNRVANWHANREELQSAMRLHREALAIFEEHEDVPGIADTLDLLGMASFLSCDFNASAGHYERSIALLRDLDDQPRLSSCLVALSCLGGTIDSDIAPLVYREPAFWIRCCEEGLDIARNIGWPAGEAFALTILSAITGMHGQLGRSLAEAEAAYNIASRIGHGEWATASRYMRGIIRAELLDLPGARTDLEQALAEARVSGSHFWTSSIASRLAAVQIATGQLVHAAATLDSVIRTDKPLLSMGQRECWYVRAQLEVARGNPERALEIINQMSQPQTEPEPDNPIPQFMRVRGDAFASMGRLEDASRAYLIARDGLTLFRFQALLWRLDADRDRVYLRLGKADDAEAARRSALITIDEIASTIPQPSMREQFRKRAIAHLPADSSASLSAPLSPRELDVLALLVEGQSDREIAYALFISPRTVNRHVTAIFNKTGVNSRTAAAALAIRRGLV